MGSAWNQLEQMLTCAICLDKFKNPRLLPCQHSFCGDACMDGLVDYARRQIKCPECRAEHRIPYQGVQSLPLNVTLIRFLELHARITGEEPEPVPTFMEKCAICGEKVEGVVRCAHCDKKVCPECKEAHVDLLRREIGRINGQSRRSVGKLHEFKEQLRRAEERLAANQASVRREIEDSCRRLLDDLQAKQRRLLLEVDGFAEAERKTIDRLKLALVEELEVLESNLALADEKLTSNKFQWTDVELSECKDIYNRTMEFVRLFDPELGDFARKIRFTLIPEFETLRRRLCELGELKFSETAQSAIANSFQYCNAQGQLALELCQLAAQAQPAAGAAGSHGLAHSNSNTNLDSQLGRHLQAANSGAGGGGGGQTLELPNTLMRSQSDHRLASQFQARLKQQEAAAASAGRYGRATDFDGESAALRSRYGPPRASTKDYANELLRDWPRPSDTDDSLSTLGSSIQFKSAFMRRKEKERQQAYGAASYTNDPDDDDLTSEASYGGSLAAGARNVRFHDQLQLQGAELAAQQHQHQPAGPRVFDCREVQHAPFSGVPKLDECPQFQTRLHQLGAKAIVDKRHADEEGRRDKDLVDSARLAVIKASERIQRQMSEDEIEKQKQANRAAGQAVTAPAAPATPPERPAAALASESAASEPPSAAIAAHSAGSSSPAPPTSASNLPGGRRNLYGQAVTERSRRQLSSAIQEAEAAAASTRRARNSEDAGRAEVAAAAGQPTQSTSGSSSSASNTQLSSGSIRRRVLRSGGRSLSKQSSSERQQSLDGSLPSTAAATAGSSSPGTPGARRRRLLRGDSSRQDSAESGGAASEASQPAASATTSGQTKNYSIGSAGGELSLDDDERSSASALRRAHQDSPVRASARPSVVSARQPAAGRQATSSTTDEDDDDDDATRDTGTMRRAAQLRHKSSSSFAKSQDPADSDTADGDESASERRPLARRRPTGHARSPHSADDSDDSEGQGSAAAARADPREASKRRSREFLPSAVNKLLDRSAQIRRDSQEQRTRADSPGRSAAGSPAPTEAAAPRAALRQRLAYGRSQSGRNEPLTGNDETDVATNSSQSLYTTASSASSGASGRRSSIEEEGARVSSASSSGRRPSSSSTDRTVIARHEPPARYTSSGSRRDSNGESGAYTSRFLTRSRTTAALAARPNAAASDYAGSERNSPPATGHEAAGSSGSSTRSYLSSRDRFMQSASVMGPSSGSGGGGTSGSASPSTGGAYSSSRAAGSSAGRESMRTHSEYLRNKFSRRNSSNSSSNSSAAHLLSRSRSSHLMSRQESGGAYSLASRELSLDDEQPGELATGSRRGSSSAGSSSQPQEADESSVYASKGRLLFKLGSRGSEPAHFTWPRGVAVGSLAGARQLVVADSSNHRVQVFTPSGRFLSEFGAYGSAPGQFDCLAGVALNRRSQQYVVSDRYNHRVQLFDAQGRFVRAFGQLGRPSADQPAPGFNLPWGVACDQTSGSIYVCDKENHCVQVFDSQGAYLSRFGSPGAQPGQLQHPHYIAVGAGKLVLTDTNNHRVQLFDLSGRLISTIGREGSAPGQFKFPRGVAMDDQGHLVVGDSGNNRLQIFAPDGHFVRAIGTWGSAHAEFKGIEGVAVDSSTSSIFVCDRENHRIQVF